MKLLVITRDPQRGGQVKKTVVADWVRVGRNASSEIFLPDPRIALEQGMIVYRDGLVYLEGESGVASKNTTRKSVRSVRLKPGQPVDIGPYRLETLPAPPGFDGAISVELVRPLEIAPGLANRTSHLTLGSLGLTKRWAAWAAVAAILFIFLAIPAGRVLHLPWARAATELGIGDRLVPTNVGLLDFRSRARKHAQYAGANVNARDIRGMNPVTFPGSTGRWRHVRRGRPQCKRPYPSVHSQGFGACEKPGQTRKYVPLAQNPTAAQPCAV